MKFIYYILTFLCLVSCSNVNKKDIVSLLQRWENKEIILPANTTFVVQDRDTVHFPILCKYKIMTYVDSMGCTSCRLQLQQWKKFIKLTDSISSDSIQFLFFFSPKKNMDVYRALRMANFEYPVCIDIKDSLNKLNHFPPETAFQTFLLDNNNKVLAIGNPIHNFKVKDLYLKIIRGDTFDKKMEKEVVTTVSLDKSIFSMGTFSWEKEQNTTFLLKNIGDKAFVINDVTTSCGCTSVEYSKEPIRPGKSLALHVTYKADHPGHFDKTVSVYCNVPSSPIQLRIRGNAN